MNSNKIIVDEFIIDLLMLNFLYEIGIKETSKHLPSSTELLVGNGSSKRNKQTYWPYDEPLIKKNHIAPDDHLGMK